MLSNLLIALVLYSLGWEATFHGCKALLEDKSGFLADTSYKDCLAVAKYWPVSLPMLALMTAFYLVSSKFKSWILNRQLRKMTENGEITPAPAPFIESEEDFASEDEHTE